MAAAARELFALATPEQRQAGVDKHLKGGVAPPELVKTVMDEAPSVSVGKQIIGAMVNFAFGDDCDANDAITICTAVVDTAGGRMSSYGEECVRAREVLADVYEGSDMTNEALKVLLTMPTESGLRSANDDYKASLNVRIADLSLDVDNTVQAESYIHRAWPLMRSVKDPELRLKFDTCFATISDVKRKFLDACQRFYALSQTLEDGIPALRKAIICVILADAGPKRAKLLATLVKDERIATVGELSSILSKVYRERVLREKDVAVITPYLKPHHKAIMKDGRTVFDGAVTQHNLLSASKLYYNISFNELGVLLGVAPEAAERIAAQMVAEDRLKASIDQETEYINFESDKAAPIELWDKQIAGVCHGVSAVADDIMRLHPNLAN